MKLKCTTALLFLMLLCTTTAIAENETIYPGDTVLLSVEFYGEIDEIGATAVVTKPDNTIENLILTCDDDALYCSGNFTNTSLPGNYKARIELTYVSRGEGGVKDMGDVSFTVLKKDTLPPNITANPENNSYIKPGLLNFTISDEHLNRVFVNGEEANVSSGITTNNSIIINTTNWNDGEYNISIYANDTSGNENNKTFTYTIDTIPPAITASHSNNSFITPGTVLNFTIFDKYLNKVFINGEEVNIHSMSTTNSQIIDTTGWPDGVHNVTIYATDLSGNENRKTFTFKVDTTPPWIYPAEFPDEIFTGEQFRFSINVTDNFEVSSVEAVLILPDGTHKKISSYFDGEEYTARINPSDAGKYKINITARDGVGNVRNRIFSFEAQNLSINAAVNITVMKKEVKNETKFIETSLKIIDDENNTIGVVTFNTTENKFFDATHLRFANGTIYYESESGERKWFNATAVIGFWDSDTGQWEREKIGFEVSNGKIEKDVSEILESVSMERKGEQERNENVEIIEPLQEEKVKVIFPENLTEGKTFETEVRDENGNLIKNKEVEITLPNGNKIKVKTDESGKVKLMMNNGEIVPAKKANVKLPKNLEEGKVYEVEVRDENGNLIKNKEVEIILPDGKAIRIKTDGNGRIQLMQRDGKIMQIQDNGGLLNNISKFHGYYFLPLLLIPALLFFTLFILQENKVVSDMEFLQKVNAKGSWNELINKFKIYVTPGTYTAITNWNVDMKNIEESKADDEIALASKLKIKKILTENPEIKEIAKEKGIKTVGLDEV
ncbi:MAG: hypothetical protein CVT90_00510 [Candidatus Altiarchaeales archaeon HGW-Altiarchaeales-3]|nr:MAG: hypothetical protein CVT90_00510 [Candidatus Altiarchaeales archaeon HGW-Altiarchaeales-3]